MTYKNSFSAYRTAPALAALAMMVAPAALAQTSYTSTSATTAWNAGRWNNSTDAAPYTSTYTANNNVTFSSGSYSFAGMGATVNVGNVTVNSGVTVNFPSIGSTFATSGSVRTFDIGSGGLFDFQSQSISTAAGTGFIKSGAGVFALGGAAYTGGFTLNAGTVILRGVNAMGSGGALTLNGGVVAGSATRDLTGKYTTGITVGGNVQFGEFTSVVSIANDTANLTFSNAVGLGGGTRTFTLGNKGTVTFSGVISNGALNFGAAAGADASVSSNGRFDITNSANTFTGNINIDGPEVRFSADGSLGNSANDIIIDGGRFSKASDATTVTLGAGRDVYVGDGAGTSISSPGSGTFVINSGILNKTAETGSLSKQGGGVLELGGVSTYSGNTAINNGTVRLTTGNNRLPTTTVLSLGQAASTNLGTLNLNGFNQEVAGLQSTAGTNAGASDNTVTSATAATLTVNNSSNHTYGSNTAANSGVITGSISLVKQGAGTLTLGDANTYTGSTTVSAGALLVNGSLASGSAISVNAGTLGGNGAAAGTVAVGASGRLAPGGAANFVGTLATGGITWADGGSYDWNLLDATGSAGTAYDNLNLGSSTLNLGSVSAGGFNLNLATLSANGTTGNAINWANTTPKTWTILTSGGITGFSDTLFNIDATGFSNSLGGGSFSVAQSGNNINLLFTPLSSSAYLFDVDGATAGAGNPSGSYNFSDALWSSNTGGTVATAVFTAGETMTFSAGTDATGTFSVNVDASASVNGITVQEGNVTLASGAGDLTLIGNSVSVGTGASLTITEPLMGGVGLSKSGTGTLTLSAANSHSGPTQISDGTLRAGNSGALGNAANTLTLSAGGTLDLNGNSVTAGAFSGAGGTVTNSSGTPGILTVGDATTPAAFAGSIQDGAGTVALNVQNQSTTGRVTLSGNNTYTGGTTVGSGQLRLDAATALPTSGPIAVNDAARLTFNLAGTYGGAGQSLTLNANQTATAVMDILSDAAVTFAGNVALATGSTNRVEANGSAGALTLSGHLSGSGLLLKQASGNLILSGTGNTATGQTQIGNGTITVNSGSLLPTGALQFAQTSTNQPVIQLNNAAQTVAGLSSTWTATSGTRTQTLVLNGTALTVNQTTDGVFGQGLVNTLNSVITGTGSLIKTGSATLTLSSANTFTGGTTISAGTLTLTGGGLLASSGTVQVSAGTLDISAINPASMTVGGLSGAGTVQMGVKNLVVNGSNTFSGTLVSSTGGLTKSGAGTFTLAAASPSFGGGAEVTAGTLALGASNALGTTGVLYVSNNASLTGAAGTTTANPLNLTAFAGGTATLAQWNFNASNLTPSVGSGTAAYVGGTTLSSFASGSGSSDPAGTNNAWNVTTWAPQGTQDKLRGVEFAVSTAGVSDIGLKFDQRNSSTGPREFILQYSTDGSTFTDYATYTRTVDSVWFNNQSVDLSAVTAINNNANFKFRLVASFTGDPGTVYDGTTGSYATGGTSRFDMVTVTNTSAAQQPTVGIHTAGAATFSGAVTLNGAANFHAASGGTVNFTGNIANGTPVGSVIKTGDGAVVLSGADNDYTGPTQITAGTLSTAGNGIGDLSAVVMSDVAGAQLVLTGNEQVGSLAGGGAAGGNVNTGANVLTVGNDDTSTTYAGVISGTGGYLNKRGSGTFTLTGGNTFTGGVIINNGTLVVPSVALDGMAQALGSAGTINMQNASTLRITGGGSMDRDLLLTGSAATIDVGTTVDFAGDHLQHRQHLFHQDGRGHLQSDRLRGLERQQPGQRGHVQGHRRRRDQWKQHRLRQHDPGRWSDPGHQHHRAGAGRQPYGAERLRHSPGRRGPCGPTP
jgi:fibronectin-binding autotransporter adhesin